MSTLSLSGSCLCGVVRYVATGQTQRFWHCHCKRCRKASGTGHASNIFLEGSLAWESGEDATRNFKPPDAKRFTNTFCQTCGSRLPRYNEELGMVFIPAGSLDDEPDISPQGHIFISSRAAWSCGGAVLPEFEEYPG